MSRDDSQATTHEIANTQKKHFSAIYSADL